LAPVFPTLLFGFFALSAAVGLAEETPQRDLRSASPTPAESDPATIGSASADPDESSEASEPEDWTTRVDRFFGKYLVKPLDAVLFFGFWTEDWLGAKVPLVVLWLLAGAIFFTLRMGFINFRGFWHAIRLTRGHYDNPEETGEVSHFQALASALSATVGLGNIAGVAIAVGNGGPGAIFWMILAGLFGMSSKFAECSLSQMYRKVAPDGTVSGGPMHYLHAGLKEIRLGRVGLGPVGAVLAVVFALVCMGGSFGGGCVFQVSQSLGPIREKITVLQDHGWIYGVVLVVLVGIVIIGGIRRIAATAEKIVPLMCVVYVLTAIYILLANYSQIGVAFGLILEGAFTGEGIRGGVLGVMVIGIKRAAFSNEAGIGSAAIAHAAAKTEEPIREGIVASLGPFIDTVIICTMTGLVIVITGAYDNPEYAQLIADENGAALTSRAFEGVVSWFPWILCLAVFLFAYSTMISWSYYGERCWSHLFGRRSSLLYKLLFLVFVMLGSVVTATKLKDFSDLMILTMAFPNILGVMLLSGKIRRALDDYWRRYKAGEMERG
jgi:AGCS family alanine or glycine:cation symporter